MEVKKVSNIKPESADMVTVKQMGKITEIRFCKTTGGSPIQKVDKDHGIDVRTGELVEFRHNTSRASDKASVAQSLKDLCRLVTWLFCFSDGLLAPLEKVLLHLLSQPAAILGVHVGVEVCDHPGLGVSSITLDRFAIAAADLQLNSGATMA